MLKQQLERDLKAALLGGDKGRVLVLRGIKSVILYAEVAQGKRDEGISDEETIVLLAKEAKKRQEAADLYIKGGSPAKAEQELAEKAIIEEYLPTQLSDDELKTIIDTIIATFDAPTPQLMGQIIGQVKQKVGASADGTRIARFVKERLTEK